MKKIISLVLLAGLLMAVVVPSAFAAITDSQQKEMDRIAQQMIDLEKEMVQQYLEAGMISQAEADYMLQRIEAKSQFGSQYRNQNNFGWGGMMNGFGGMGRMGCWW